MISQGTRTIDLLLAYYGDDFTGSTDVLEALTSGGVETVLFVEPPSDDMLRRYAHVRAFGIAGNSRTMSPDEMDESLPDVFRMLLVASAADRSLQSLFDVRFVARSRQHRPGDRHRPSRLSESARAAGRGCAVAAAILRLRQSVRAVRARQRPVPARSSPDDAAPSGHADERSGPARAPVAANVAAH